LEEAVVEVDSEEAVVEGGVVEVDVGEEEDGE